MKIRKDSLINNQEIQSHSMVDGLVCFLNWRLGTA